MDVTRSQWLILFLGAVLTLTIVGVLLAKKSGADISGGKVLSIAVVATVGVWVWITGFATIVEADVAPPNTNVGQALNELEVKGRAAKTGYSRDQYGPSWYDVDKNKCDTRNDILARDLTQKVYQDDCIILSGVLQDPYGGGTIQWKRGVDTSSAVQVDHIVALSDSWQKGAQEWSPEKRLAFANDPLNLVAADGPLNMAKSDGDAATWLPPNKGYWCEYVTSQVAVKRKYGLWVTPAEKNEMAKVLNDCPDGMMPTSKIRVPN